MGRAPRSWEDSPGEHPRGGAGGRGRRGRGRGSPHLSGAGDSSASDRKSKVGARQVCCCFGRSCFLFLMLKWAVSWPPPRVLSADLRLPHPDWYGVSVLPLCLPLLFSDHADLSSLPICPLAHAVGLSDALCAELCTGSLVSVLSQHPGLWKAAVAALHPWPAGGWQRLSKRSRPLPAGTWIWMVL